MVRALCPGESILLLVGVSRNALMPLGLLCIPQPVICPRALISMAYNNCQPEDAGIRVFRSMPAPFSHSMARIVVEPPEAPTIRPRWLTALATLSESPGNVPRSVTVPFDQAAV